MNSLLDTDLYKYTMGQFVFHKWADIPVEYTFKCRNGSGIPIDMSTSKFTDMFSTALSSLCNLRHTADEIVYLKSLGKFSRDYLEFLTHLKLDRSCIDWNTLDGELHIKIRGSWIDTIWFEVPILSILSGIDSYYSEIRKWNTGKRILENKIKRIREHHFKLIDFGTRRRASLLWHNYVIDTLHTELPKDVFLGTSNLYFGKMFNIPVFGTQAHEIFMAYQVLSPIYSHQKYLLQDWLDEFDVENAIALTDTLGIDTFLQDFDARLATEYDGCRHDSGDWAKWSSKLNLHYCNLGIDPSTKDVLFSDGLNIEKAISINECLKGIFRNIYFCIGTNLTNDCGYMPPNIVIKMTKCNGKHVAKISDSPGKGMCESRNYIKFLKEEVCA